MTVPWRLHLGCQNIDLSSASGRWCFAAEIAVEPAIGRRRHAVFGSLPGRSGVGCWIGGVQRGLRRPVASLKARQSFRLRTSTSNVQSTHIHSPFDDTNDGAKPHESLPRASLRLHGGLHRHNSSSGVVDQWHCAPCLLRRDAPGDDQGTSQRKRHGRREASKRRSVEDGLAAACSCAVALQELTPGAHHSIIQTSLGEGFRSFSSILVGARPSPCRERRWAGGWESSIVSQLGRGLLLIAVC